MDVSGVSPSQYLQLNSWATRLDCLNPRQPGVATFVSPWVNANIGSVDILWNSKFPLVCPVQRMCVGLSPAGQNNHLPSYPK